jgi:hypothetical protein
LAAVAMATATTMATTMMATVTAATMRTMMVGAALEISLRKKSFQTLFFLSANL